LRRIVVVGSGTGVGKTHVACALLGVLRGLGIDAVGLKPVESGCAGGVAADAARLASCSRGAAPWHAFADPVSPHLAARRAGVEVDVEALVAWAEAHGGAWQVVESAGALLSPLSTRATNLELTRALRPSGVVLAAFDRLGALHDVAACMAALRSRGLAKHTVVALGAPEVPDAASGTNAGELVALGIAPAVVSFPRAAVETPASSTAAEALFDALGQCSTRN
jgi:dethiobiotin synthetase